LAGVIALKSWQHDEVIQLIHDKGLLIIPIGLNDETVTWPIVDGIPYLLKLNCDRAGVFCAGCINKDLCNRDGS
jgi:hypothetical protein